MNIAAEQRAQRQAAAVQRLVASRTRLRTRLIRVKPVGGLSGRVAGITEYIAALVQRHPGFSAGGAVILGALLVRARPWRWALTTGIWSMVVPRALPILAATLTAARLGQWADLIINWMRTDDPKPEETTAPVTATTQPSAPAR